MRPTIAAALAGSQLDLVDARALLRHACGVDDAYLVAHANDGIGTPELNAFDALVARRRAGEPIAYIVGTREFYSLDFVVTPAVLIPRPETELLVELALAHLQPGRASRVLDLGTGSGCIAIAIAKHRPRTEVIAVERSAPALDVARDNARRLEASNVEFRLGDWFSAVGNERFDVIVANPPYIAAGDPHLVEGDLPAEPRDALVAGTDGLDAVREIVRAASRHLSDAGLLAVEHGYDQASRVREMLEASGFAGVASRRDLAEIERVSGGIWTRS